MRGFYTNEIRNTNGGCVGEKAECIHFAMLCDRAKYIKIINVISAVAATDKCNLLLVSLL